jgi:hypothetical protein
LKNEKLALNNAFWLRKNVFFNRKRGKNGSKSAFLASFSLFFTQIFRPAAPFRAFFAVCFAVFGAFGARF